MQEPTANNPPKAADGGSVPRPGADPRVGGALEASGRSTLVMLAAVVGVAFISWGTAHTACNRRPPRYKEPRAQEVSRLVRSPKGAATEFHRRLLLQDFKTAGELAEGPAREIVAATARQCARGECETPTELLSVAQVLKPIGAVSNVRVQTIADGTEAYHLVEVQRSSGSWKVQNSVPTPDKQALPEYPEETDEAAGAHDHSHNHGPAGIGGAGSTESGGATGGSQDAASAGAAGAGTAASPAKAGAPSSPSAQ